MLLKKYRARIEEALRLSIIEMGEKNRLRDACEYTLSCGGKRVRPLIVLLIAEALQLGLDAMHAALSVEFFHTASLIADDLPCMDDDDFRRNRPSLHKEFGENLAILSSYTLIAAGYEGIYKNAVEMKKNSQFKEKANEALFLSLEAATRCAGIQGATNGQFLDLFPPDASLETIYKTIYQKTVTLFEIAFTFGWLFGGGSSSSLESLRKCAYHLGMAFQIGDDLDDDVQDGSSVNIVKVLGKEKAELLWKEEILQFRKSLEGLGLWTAPFQELYFFLFTSQTGKLSAVGAF
jgi:geranylgeranyl diphosphate synthase type II